MPGSYTSQPSRKFVAGENLASYRVVTGAAAVFLAHSADAPPIGTTGIDGGVSSGENVDVLLMNAPGTRLLTAGDAITAGYPVAVTTDGKVIAYTTEEYIFGVALEAAAGANAVIEVLPLQCGFYSPSGS